VKHQHTFFENSAVEGYPPVLWHWSLAKHSMTHLFQVISFPYS